MMPRVYVIDMGRAFYYLQWDDPYTGKRITRSSKCKTRRDAERKALTLENQLSTDSLPGRMQWREFVSRYQMEHLPGLALRSRMKACSVLDTFQRLMQPRNVESATSAMMSQYIAKLRELNRTEATIAGHLRQIRAALNWGHERGFVGLVPKMPAINRAAGSRHAKGRPITAAEFAKMVRASREICGPRWRSWAHLMRGLWLSGLRLGEACKLRWEPGNWPSVSVDSRGVLIVPASHDKSHQDRVVPLTPDFEAWLRRTPLAQRRGPVFRPLGKDGEPVGFFNASHIISAIGETAGVVVDPVSGKTASAHDLRRAFAQRWASRLAPLDLQRLMRHASIATTQNYYLDHDADGLSERIRSTFETTQ